MTKTALVTRYGADGLISASVRKAQKNERPSYERTAEYDQYADIYATKAEAEAAAQKTLACDAEIKKKRRERKR